MKTRKILGNLLAGLGGVLFFVGLLALLLPRSANPQLQLVLSSFRTPTDNGFLQWINNIMTGAMANSMQVIVTGLVLAVVGILLIFSVRTNTGSQQVQRTHQPVHAVPAAVPVQANPFARTQPAVVNESNPFARYIAPDALPKSTEVRSTAPAAAQEPGIIPAAAVPMDDEPADNEEILYGLVDDDEEDDLSFDGFYPLQAEEESADEPVPADEPLPEEQPEADEVQETVEEKTETEAVVEPDLPVQADETETFILPETAPLPEEPTAAEPQIEAVEEVSAAEEPQVQPELSQETNIPAAQPVTAGESPAPSGLRPAIRSTFRKSTAGSSTDPQPVSRIKSTMGHKR